MIKRTKLPYAEKEPNLLHYVNIPSISRTLTNLLESGKKTNANFCTQYFQVHRSLEGINNKYRSTKVARPQIGNHFRNKITTTVRRFHQTLSHDTFQFQTERPSWNIVVYIHLHVLISFFSFSFSPAAEREGGGDGTDRSRDSCTFHVTN